MKIFFLISSLLVASPLFAQTEEVSLQEQLNSLELPSNKLPQQIQQEKLYAVQDRYSPLKNRLETGFWGGQNFTAEGHLTSQLGGAWVQYHISDKWGMQLTGAKGGNRLNSSGRKLMQDKALLPDVDYLKAQVDLGVTYNTLYGKFRLVGDTVMYFDQYLMLGAGLADLKNGRTPILVGDMGLAFWPGKKWGLKVGLRHHLYEENRSESKVRTYSMIGHLDMSFVFGGES